MRLLIIIMAVLGLQHLALAGPFTISGQSTARSSETTYRQFLAPTAEQLSAGSEVTAGTSADASRSSYEHSSRPASELTTSASDASSEVSLQASEASVEVSKNGTAVPVAVSDASLEVSQQSSGPTYELSTKASESSSAVTRQSSELTAKASRQSSEASVKASRAMYQHSSRPTAELTTQATEASVEFSEFTGRPTMLVTRQSEHVALMTSHNTGNSFARTSENSEPVIRATGRVSAQSSEDSAAVSRKSGELSTQASRESGEASTRVSGALDASIEGTTRLTREGLRTTLLDPDVADQLVKEAYAMQGFTLDYFAKALLVEPLTLARVIRREVPAQASRTQLQHIMGYVVPALDEPAGG